MASRPDTTAPAVSPGGAETVNAIIAGGVRDSRTSSAWRAMAIVIAISVLGSPGQFVRPLESMDESLLLVYPEQILLGRLPHVDFFTVYGPGGFAVLAGLFAGTGPSVAVERLLGLAYHVAIATGLVKLTRPFGQVASCAAGTTAALLLLSLGLPAFAWLGGLALLIWFLALLSDSRDTKSVFLAGLLAALVSAWRMEMVALVFSAIPLVWRFERWKPLIIGCVAGLAPMAVYLAVAGRQLYVNVVQSRIGVNAQTNLHQVPASVWFGIVTCLVCTGALAISARRRSGTRRLSISLAMLSVLLLPQAVQRVDSVHLLYVMCVIAPTGLAALLSSPFLAGRLVGIRGPHRRLVATSVGFFLCGLTALSLLTVVKSHTVAFTHNGRTVPIPAEAKPSLAASIRLITRNIEPGSNVFVGASDMSVPTGSDIRLYHLLPEYRATANYLELPPGVAEKRGSPLIDDVLAADALILSHVPRAYGRMAYPHIGPGEPEVNEAIQTHFCLAGRDATLSVYIKCEFAAR